VTPATAALGPTARVCAAAGNAIVDARISLYLYDAPLDGIDRCARPGKQNAHITKKERTSKRAAEVNLFQS
jgi:hypothetical protein